MLYACSRAYSRLIQHKCKKYVQKKDVQSKRLKFAAMFFLLDPLCVQHSARNAKGPEANKAPKLKRAERTRGQSGQLACPIRLRSQTYTRRSAEHDAMIASLKGAHDTEKTSSLWPSNECRGFVMLRRSQSFTILSPPARQHQELRVRREVLQEMV